MWAFLLGLKGLTMVVDSRFYQRYPHILRSIARTPHSIALMLISFGHRIPMPSRVFHCRIWHLSESDVCRKVRFIKTENYLARTGSCHRRILSCPVVTVWSYCYHCSELAVEVPLALGHSSLDALEHFEWWACASTDWGISQTTCRLAWHGWMWFSVWCTPSSHCRSTCLQMTLSWSWHLVWMSNCNFFWLSPMCKVNLHERSGCDWLSVRSQSTSFAALRSYTSNSLDLRSTSRTSRRLRRRFFGKPFESSPSPVSSLHPQARDSRTISIAPGKLACFTSSAMAKSSSQKCHLYSIIFECHALKSFWSFSGP